MTKLNDALGLVPPKTKYSSIPVTPGMRKRLEKKRRDLEHDGDTHIKSWDEFFEKTVLSQSTTSIPKGDFRL